jgi:hypothetical protein
MIARVGSLIAYVPSRAFPIRARRTHAAPN